jgi:hypothetical protein
LLTFFAAAKKVSAAPHRGNARAARRIAEAGGTPTQPPQKSSRRHKPHTRMHAASEKHRQ